MARREREKGGDEYYVKIREEREEKEGGKKRDCECITFLFFSSHKQFLA